MSSSLGCVSAVESFLALLAGKAELEVHPHPAPAVPTGNHLKASAWPFLLGLLGLLSLTASVGPWVHAKVLALLERELSHLGQNDLPFRHQATKR